MMQGDSYGLPIELLKADGSVLTAADVLEVEGTIGSLTKTYTDGGMTFSSADNKWRMLLTQEETLMFPNARLKAQVRVKLKDGSVHGLSLGTIRVHESISKVVL